MKSFIFQCSTVIRYGVGESLKLYERLQEMGYEKVIILTGKYIKKSELFLDIMKELDCHQVHYELCDKTMPEPTVNLVNELVDWIRSKDVDAVVAIGGGSILDTAKAVCMLKNNEGYAKDYMYGGTRTIKNLSLPLICIPATAGSGSEVTGASVLTDEESESKASISSGYLIPKLAIVDPLIQVSMPPSIAASTGVDALTHAIESFVSKHANPMSEMYSRQAIKIIGESLRKAVFEPDNLEEKGKMAFASTIAAVAFMNGGLGAVHGISQSAGGIAHVSHGVGNAMLLPYVMEVNMKGNIEKFAEIAQLLGERTEGLSTYEAAEKSIQAVRCLVEDLSIPSHLQEVNVTKEMFPAIIKGTMEYRLLAQNPVPFNEHIVNTILEKAY